MFLNIVKIAFLTFALTQSLHSATITYTDRAEFENALNSFTVDHLNGIQSGYYTGAVNTLFRDDYVASGSNPNAQLYGCVYNVDCDTLNTTFDDSYILTWNKFDYSYDFVFDGSTTNISLNISTINGFGFDYASAFDSSPVLPVLNGIAAPTTSGFFGIISDENMGVVTLNQTNNYLILDNITYGTVVPIPASLWLFLTGIIFMSRFVRKLNHA